MGVNLQEFISDKIIGNVRIGYRDVNDVPKKTDYFGVHLDKSTPQLAVDIFNEVYDKPNRLKIRFIEQHPIEVFLERYDGKKRRCYGNCKEAVYTDDKGKKQKIQCQGKKCQYFKDKQCKFVGKLYFLIDKLEDEGIWCYPIRRAKWNK